MPSVRLVRSVFVVAAVVGWAACSSSTTADGWSTDCAHNSDCTLMPFGDPCRSCAERYDPVSVVDVGAILDEATGAGSTCPIWYEWTDDDCAERPDSAPVCTDGTCTATTSGGACAAGGQGFCQGVD